jgi:hypothetical protein
LSWTLNPWAWGNVLIYFSSTSNLLYKAVDHIFKMSNGWLSIAEISQKYTVQFQLPNFIWWWKSMTFQFSPPKSVWNLVLESSDLKIQSHRKFSSPSLLWDGHTIGIMLMWLPLSTTWSLILTFFFTCQHNLATWAAMM